MITAISYVLAASVLAIHVEESEGVTAGETDVLVRVLSEGLANRFNAEAEVIDSRKIQLTCPTVQRCGIEIAARTGATSVVYLRILGIPAKIRVIAESAGEFRGSATLDLSRDQKAWKVALAKIVSTLFPAPAITTVEPRAAVRLEPVIEERDRSLGPWIALGAGAGFGVSAVIVGLKNRAQVREGETSSDPVRVAELRDSVSTSGLAANLMIGAAIVSVAGGITWLILDAE